MDWKKYFDTENEKPLDRLVEGYSNTAIFRSIAFIGDSLSSGEFETVDENGQKGYHDLYEYSWGQYIARKNGLKAYNFSRGGMTAKEYMKLCGESLGMKNSDIAKRSEELLRLVGLEGEIHRIKGYSRGMKQRLGIAQALLGRPKLLICDEPTSALDPIGRKEILDILLSVKEHTTVLFSTHILSDVERICTDVAFLSDGKIAMQGSVEQLKNMGRADEFTVETLESEDVDKLVSAFENARKTVNDTVVFSGGEKELFAVMSFITQNKLKIAKIERAEPTLESLFLEVAAK